MNRAMPLEDQRRQGGFPAEAFDRLASLEPGHYWFESRNQLIVWAMGRYFPHAKTLLEVGCGTGFVLQGLQRMFPRLQLTATDAMSGGLAIAGRRVPTATLAQQDARDLDAVDQFDVVCAFDVLEHIPEDGDVLNRLYAAATPGGGALITVPQHPRLWSRLDELGHHVRRYRRRELVERMHHAGFELVRVTSFVSLLLPLLAASRWLDARSQRAPTYREFEVSPMLNAVLGWILGIERAAIRRGVSWPAGGSLLAVARKPLA